MADTTPTLREALAAEQAETVAAPAGYALVRTPITEEMHAAAAKVLVRAHGLDGTPQRMLDAMIAAAPPAPAAEQAEPVAVDVTLTEEETSFLRDTMGADEGEAPDAIRLTVGNGHSGYGLYVSLAEYGNEGSSLLKALAAPPAPAPTWPEWAEQILKIVREYSGYDGYDDADGVDLPEEVREALEELTAQITRLEAKAPAPAADAMPAGWREVIADVAADISDHPSLACEKLRRLLAAPSAPARQEWQPIETAPTDTEVLIGAWIDGEFKWGRSVRFYDSGNEREGEPACGWVWSIDDCSDSVAENPTHWQPLPAAPITAAPAEGGAA